MATLFDGVDLTTAHSGSAAEPEHVTVETLLACGTGICSGYVPDTTPGRYLELYEYRGYVYAVVCYEDGSTRAHKLGIRWGDR